MYTIKNYKTIPSDYGDSAEDGYICTVYRDGKRLGTFTMPANGGICPILRMADADKTKLIDDARIQTGVTASPIDAYTYDPSADPADDGLVVGIFLEDLIVEYEKQRQMKRWCKTSTLFTVQGDEAGSFRTIKVPYSVRVHSHIVQKYGDRVTGIWDANTVKVA